MNVFSLLQQSVSRFGSQGAVYVDTGPFQTCAELHDGASRLAARLRTLRPACGRVAIASENRAEYIEIIFGIWAADGVVVPLDSRLLVEELGRVLDDADVSTVFASPKLAAVVSAALERANARPRHLVVIGSPPYEQLSRGRAVQPLRTDAEAPAWLFYTRGPAGEPEGIMLSHRDLMAMTSGDRAAAASRDQEASYIHAAPMSGVSGLYMASSIARGARQVIPASSAFWPDEFIDLCSVHPDCVSFLAPSMVQRLRYEVESSGRRPMNLRTIVHDGDAMHAGELRKAMAVLGSIFVRARIFLSYP